MMWSDIDIRAGQLNGLITVYPDLSGLQPASLDVRLGNVFRQFKKPTLLERLTGKTRVNVPGSTTDMRLFKVPTYMTLQPGEFILGTTQERVSLSDTVVARVEGKSSLGRLGLAVHVTAGFIDPGFSGYITLEILNVSPLPIRLTPGMYIAQLAFMSLQTPCEVPYGEERGSRYTDQNTPEPVGSRPSVYGRAILQNPTETVTTDDRKRIVGKDWIEQYKNRDKV